MVHIPYIIEKTGRTEKPIDIFSRLLSDRIIYFGTEVTDETANVAIMQLLWLAADDPEAPIDFYINSPGGDVYAGQAIKDIIYNIPCKVNTIGLGMCASMGAYLLSCGTGERKATQNCRIMIHSVSSGSRGTYHDLKIDFEETEYLQRKLIQDMANFSKGKSTSKSLEKSTERDKYLTPEQAIALGLIDSII